MRLRDANLHFGICWLSLGYKLALHVLDEAGDDFLAYYIPNALAIRRAVLAVPIFTFQSWIGSLALALTLLPAFAPLAFRGQQWIG